MFTLVTRQTNPSSFAIVRETTFIPRCVEFVKHPPEYTREGEKEGNRELLYLQTPTKIQAKGAGVLKIHSLTINLVTNQIHCHCSKNRD